MPDRLAAPLLCVLACLFFAGATAFGKAAQDWPGGAALHPFQVTAARFLGAFVVLLPLAVLRGPGILQTAIPWRHLQRVLLGFAAVSCIFAATARLPLGDVLAVAWAAPLFALVFAGLLLGERVGRRRWLAALAGFVGVAIMMRPTDAAFGAAASIALAAAVLTGLELVLIRILARRDPALTVLVLNNALGTIIAGAAASLFWVTPSAPQALLLALVGPTMLAGQALFFRALQLAETSAVAPFYYATVLWGVVIGLVVFDEVPGWHLFVGGGLIVAGGVYVALQRPALATPAAVTPTPPPAAGRP
ncbi:MAG: DMT family transporter [Geminicoccaceae bacterium]|nr:MAG: DMT family transporter [Geminicoccaceae bacterium]